MKYIFENADILSIHIPLTEETSYLINDKYINNFKKNIYLINTARGKCVNTEHLVKSLKSGKIQGACLDVLEYENISFENLKKDGLEENLHYLTNCSKVILSPHIAGWTHESNLKIAKILFQKISNDFS
jgi:D-3-phosphoglycerate dehydrogenase